MATVSYNNGMKLGALTFLLAAMFSLSARGAIELTATGSQSAMIGSFGDYRTGDITFYPPASTTSGLQIYMVQLVLTFSSAEGLTGNDPSDPLLQGHIILGGTDDSPFINFYPTVTSGSGPYTYDVTFTGTAADNSGTQWLECERYLGFGHL